MKVSIAKLFLYDENGELIKSGEIDYQTFNDLINHHNVTEKNPVDFLYSVLLEQIAEESGG